MNNIKYELGIMSMFNLFKLDSKYALKMYDELLNLFHLEMFLNLFKSTIITIYNDHLLTKESLLTIEIIFERLYHDYPDKKVYINKFYYSCQTYLKKVKIDTKQKLLYDDINKRYFGINNGFEKFINKYLVHEFYDKNYELVMEDIIYDISIFRYMLGDSNDILTEKYNNCLRYLYLTTTNNEIINRLIDEKLEEILYENYERK